MRLRRKLHKPRISILIPFRDNDEQRTRVFEWVKEFWQGHVPAEVIVGTDEGIPFSKAVAVNDAASRAKGDVFVILDADCYMDPAVVEQCVRRILSSSDPLWFIPYMRLYRLTEAATLDVIAGDPGDSYTFPSPPPPELVEDPSSASYGHQYGALIQIMPREAFELVGGMDTRFRGWGSEDAAFLRALDTLYAPHELTDNDTLHLWHVRPGTNFLTRKWFGQTKLNVNSDLARRYGQATGDPVAMRALVDEGHGG